MPVGSHKDAFKAHQLVKRLAGREGQAPLAWMAVGILMDFVKHQRQVKAERISTALPPDLTIYDEARLLEALRAVDSLCGHCEESHDDGCYVNQTRRILIAAKTKVDLGPSFDGRQNLEELMTKAMALARTAMGPTTAMECPAGLEGADSKADRPTYEELAAQVREMKDRDIFRATLIDEIMETIRNVADGNFAASMPVHDDEQLGKLATAFNLMLHTVDTTMRNLDQLVAERSSEMRMIMDTVPVGLLTLNQDLVINPEYSKTCEAILGLTDLRGRSFLDAVGLTRRRNREREMLKDFLELFQQMLLPEEDMRPLNPFRELELPASEEKRATWLRLNYHLIKRGDGQVPHILVVMEDITKAKALEAQVARSERENLQLRAMAEDPDLFCEFLSDSLTLLSNIGGFSQTLETAADPRPIINELFRGVHTIKGTAGAFGLENIADLAARLEDGLSRLRGAEVVDPQTIGQTRTAIEELTNALNEVAEQARKLLGLDIGRGGESMLRVSAAAIRDRLETVRAMSLDPSTLKKEVIDLLTSLRAVPVKKGLAKALKIVPTLAERLEKKAVFVLKDHGLKIDCDLARELNAPLVHLIRNAYDHGLEPPDEREMGGKPAEGRVTLTVVANPAGLTPAGLTLTLADDGRGLDAEELKKAAVRKGLVDPDQAAVMTEDQAYALIFKPGFSTAVEVTDVSGRGVGMDVVLTTILETLGGDLSVESTPGQGTRFVMRLPAELPRR